MEQGTKAATKLALKIVITVGLTEEEMSGSYGKEIRGYAATEIQKIVRGHIGRSITVKAEKEVQKKSWIEFVGTQPTFLHKALKKVSTYERRSYTRLLKSPAPEDMYLG